jgi:hypothetical protein
MKYQALEILAAYRLHQGMTPLHTGQGAYPLLEANDPLEYNLRGEYGHRDEGSVSTFTSVAKGHDAGIRNRVSSFDPGVVEVYLPIERLDIEFEPVIDDRQRRVSNSQFDTPHFSG